jgi:hypothetical protein
VSLSRQGAESALAVSNGVLPAGLTRPLPFAHNQALSHRPEVPVRLFLTIAAAVITGTVLAAPAPKSAGLTFIDLQSKANQKLEDDVGGRTPNNTLGTVPTGEQTLAGVKFKIDKKYIQLNSPLLKEAKPEKVEGISVGRKLDKLHFLHSTIFGKSNPVIEDGTVIAEYKVHYDDGTSERINVKYGEDLRDWWFVKGGPASETKEKVAWEGENEATKPIGQGIRLYLSTWKNPKPEKKVASIDFIRNAATQASPLCVAITAE